MPRGNLLALMRDMMPTRPLLDLSGAGWHTKSSGTLCSVTDQTLIQWCKASHLRQVGPLR
jgi:hypothetical protein